MKKHRHVLACVLLLLSLALGLSLQEDDLVFDDVGEDNDNDNVPVGLPLINHRLNRHRLDHPDRSDDSSRDNRRHASRVERLWGVPDAIVPVGHVFKMKIPRQAFSGNVDFYEVVRGSMTCFSFAISGTSSEGLLGCDGWGIMD